jgi:hypothetical protein
VGWSSIYRFFSDFNQHIFYFPAVWGMKIYQQNQQFFLWKNHEDSYSTSLPTQQSPTQIKCFFSRSLGGQIFFAAKGQSATKIWPCPTSHSQLPGGPSRPDEAGTSSQRCYPGSLFTSKLLVLFMPNLVTIGFDPPPCRSPNSFIS